ncbi:MAG: HAD-IIB family hydrolase [Patescibacteria group bacterium]|nr:HAD-IIB family hydrolase [Patescibacteria group bacterium]
MKTEMKSSTSKSSRKKYKALMLDVDGTLVINRRDAMPSQKVKNAVNKAAKIIKIGVATSRPLSDINHIIKYLNLTTPCIITGGAQIYDPVSKKYILEHLINNEDIKKIKKITKNLKTLILVLDRQKAVPFNEKYSPQKPIQIWIHGLKSNSVEKLLDKFLSVPTVSVQKTPSWKNDRIDLVITNIIGTKQHGILEVAKLLNIETHEIIGVGDGYNDFPLLMACGLKIAMGNANEELKKIADFVAPSVEEDGVATVIEKFIL